MNFIKKFFNDIYIDVTWITVLTIFILFNWKGTNHEMIGVSVTIISFIFWILARQQLGQSFSIIPKASNLVSNGIYSKIKHPMYIFSSLCVLGLIIAMNLPFLYIFWVLLVVLQIFRIKKENKILYLKFGDKYKEYERNTWF